MSNYISMLRGVNVGGHKLIMGELKELYESLNLTHVKTYIQSGNVLFESSETSTLNLSQKIEAEIEKVFGFHIRVFILTRDELKMVIESNPFTDDDPKKLHVTFLSDFPVEIPMQEIEKVKSKSEKFSIHQKEVYLYLPQGYGRTKLTNNFFESKLKVRATTRNWSTVNKLYELSK